MLVKRQAMQPSVRFAPNEDMLDTWFRLLAMANIGFQRYFGP